MADRWRVTGQRATERFGSNGRFEQVVEVSVELADGTAKTFSIPEAKYNASHVADVINEWTDRAEAVANL